MSVLPNSIAFMAQAMRNHHPERETFHKFFECWLSEQNQNLHDLLSASKDHAGDGAQLRPLVDRVICHYEQYYQAKSTWAKQDVLSMFSPSWRSSFEDAFLWIGGWRPSMAIHLLYSKSGLQLEARLADLISGLRTGDLGDLSPTQLTRVDDLQRRTIRQEKEITEKLASHQESVADTSMVELSNAISEMIRSDEEGGGSGGEASPSRGIATEERVESTLAPKKDGLVELLEAADDLRLRTLKEVLDILTPIQAVHFLIAAAELHLRIHDWGKKRDAATGTHHANGLAPPPNQN